MNPLPDLGAIAIELNELMQEESTISARRRKLHERLASFPNEVALRQERAVSDERKMIHRRIDELKARLDERESAEALELSDAADAESRVPEEEDHGLRSLAALTAALTESLSKLDARITRLETGPNRP